MSTFLLNVPLNEVRTNDEQVVGSLHPEKGKVYRWVKNIGSTDLTAGGPALIVHSGAVTGNYMHRIISADTGPATAVPWMPAGSCVTGIGGSGSTTGCYGWLQVKGVASVTQQGTATALVIGSYSIASSTYPAAWASNVSYSIDTTAATAMVYSKNAQLLQAVSTAGPSTSYTKLVELNCV